MKPILVCIDASPRAPLVLETGAELARSLGAKLHILRAVGIPSDIDQDMFVHSAANLVETMIENAKVEIAMLAKDIPPALIEGIHVHVGAPWDLICREAKTLDCDLVILGSHGYSSFARVLGTTSARVVNHCERSVMVVREPARAAT